MTGLLMPPGTVPCRAQVHALDFEAAVAQLAPSESSYIVIFDARASRRYAGAALGGTDSARDMWG